MKIDNDFNITLGDEEGKVYPVQYSSRNLADLTDSSIVGEKGDMISGMKPLASMNGFENGDENFSDMSENADEMNEVYDDDVDGGGRISHPS